jgi:hypothetical protein
MTVWVPKFAYFPLISRSIRLRLRTASRLPFSCCSWNKRRVARPARASDIRTAEISFTGSSSGSRLIICVRFGNLVAYIVVFIVNDLCGKVEPSFNRYGLFDASSFLKLSNSSSHLEDDRPEAAISEINCSRQPSLSASCLVYGPIFGAKTLILTQQLRIVASVTSSNHA